MWPQIVALISTQIIVPFVILLLTFSKDQKNKLTTLCWLLFSSIYISYIHTTGRWDWVGYYVRYVWLACLLFAIYRAYQNHKRAPFWPERSLKAWSRLFFPCLMSIVFILMTLSSLVGRFYTDEAIALHFPLKNGPITLHMAETPPSLTIIMHTCRNSSHWIL